MAAASHISLSHPTVSNDMASPLMSPRYTHITTDRIVQSLQETGWRYSGGTARLTRFPDRERFVAHVLRFTNPAIPDIKDGRIEAVIINSHDGSTAFEAAVGVYRMACANGLVVRSSTLGAVRLIHSGLTMDRVMGAAKAIIDRAPKAAEVIERWSKRTLTVDEQIALAKRCARVRWEDRLRSIDVQGWLTPRRPEDNAMDLWTSFNRVQECVMRGGVRISLASTRKGEGDRHQRAVPLRGAIRQVRLNEALWHVAEEFAA